MTGILATVWILLAMATAYLLFWLVKRQKRPLNARIALYKLSFIALSALAGLLLAYSLGQSPHRVWASRAVFTAIGLLHLLVLYQQSWVKRDPFDAAEDSFAQEATFTTLLGLLCALTFVFSSRVFRLVGIDAPEISNYFWDAPLWFLLPFLAFKMSDLATQIPYRVVENLWIFPIEPLGIPDWPRRDLMQVTFELRRSLEDEYRPFRRSVQLWIEVPKQAPLGDVFRLIIQDRRRRTDLTTILDLGDEYSGPPEFWWLFSIKRVWWNPSTWSRSPRYLNADASIANCNIKKSDIIIARRMPIKGVADRYLKKDDYDAEKTIIINR